MTDRSAALAAVAEHWADPDDEARARAEEATLAADNSFTEESLAFAVNQAMDVLAGERLATWLDADRAAEPARVGVLTTGRVPLDGLFETAAAWLLGHDVAVAVASASPAFLPAFFGEVAGVSGAPTPAFLPAREVLVHAERLLATGPDPQLRTWHEQADAAGVALRHFVPSGLGVAVLDGQESQADRSSLAEDVLLHEGGTPYSVRLVFAPDGLAPDPLLDTLAAFREVVPPHAATEGRLKMPAAFLASAKQPHATGPGFLVSKGEAEPQEGAHLRWVDYETLDAVVPRIEMLATRHPFVVARPAVAGRLRAAGLPASVPILGFGDAHRPEPGQPPMTETLRAFLV